MKISFRENKGVQFGLNFFSHLVFNKQRDRNSDRIRVRESEGDRHRQTQKPKETDTEGQRAIHQVVQWSVVINTWHCNGPVHLETH